MNNIIVILFATLLTFEIFLPVFCKFMLLMGDCMSNEVSIDHDVPPGKNQQQS